MTTKDTGGSAFPTPYTTRDGDHFTTEYQDGMTLRDYFAAAALQGFIASKAPSTLFSPDEDVAYCYQIADAMLAARNTEAK